MGFLVFTAAVGAGSRHRRTALRRGRTNGITTHEDWTVFAIIPHPSTATTNFEATG
jgi:hypothetical protein